MSTFAEAVAELHRAIAPVAAISAEIGAAVDRLPHPAWHRAMAALAATLAAAGHVAPASVRPLPASSAGA